VQIAHGFLLHALDALVAYYDPLGQSWLDKRIEHLGGG
jgi:hypothetical protein